MTRVLLVEPDRIMARNYAQALESAGYEVDWAASGQAGISQADERTPDVILLELQMSRHNGLEFLHELRSYPEWQDIPVILLTMIPDAAAGSGHLIMEQLGVAGYLYKPQTKLRHVVRAVDRLMQPAL